jgi:Bacterial Ig-like domain
LRVRQNRKPTITLAGVATVTTETTLVLTATATPAPGSGFDNVGSPITKVELYDGTKKVGEKTVSPYIFEIKLTTEDNGKKQFKAKAYDQAGSVGESNMVMVDVKIAVADTTPPTVVSVDPPNDTTGVTKDKAITVVFSEPMNQVATQAAYQSADLPSVSVTLSWNTDGKILTIKPNASLEYKAVPSLRNSAKLYSFTVTSTATDLAGNKLAVLNSKFSTLKQVTTVIASENSLTGSISGGSTALNCPSICAGDTVENVGLRGFITFNLSILPSSLSVQDILGANLHFTYEGTEGSISCEFGVGYDQNRNMNSFYIENVSFDSIENSIYDLQSNNIVYIYKDNLRFCKARPSGLTFPKDIIDNKIDTFEAVKNDWENRKARKDLSQYRFRFAEQTNTNGKADYANFVRYGFNAPRLEVTYLMP